MIDNLNKKKSFWKSFFNKLIIAFFYITIFSLILYSPKFFKNFLTSEKTLNLYAFTDMVCPEIIKKFEQQTGIKIQIKYFDNNEELVAKFRIDKGAGYDLITATDYSIDTLREENLLSKIDTSKLSNFKYLDKNLLNLYFDPQNLYSIPIYWSLYVIVFNKIISNQININDGWKIAFEKQNIENYKICMTDNAKEAVFIGSIYLYSKTDNLNSEELNNIKNLLTEQKKLVEIYMSGSLQYYLYGNIVNLAVTSSAFANKLLESNQNFDFFIPNQGTLKLVDSLAIPQNCSKIDMVYKFIDFLISEETSIINSKIYGYYPSNTLAYKTLKRIPDETILNKIYMVNNKIDSKIIGDLWLAVRLA